jgi:Flp pilus assembly protein TadD
VAAQTIFSAKTRPTSTRWVGAASVMIALVAVAFGVAGLWFYLRTPATTFVPSPMVARDVEKIVPEPLQVPPVAPPAEVVAPAPVTELATAAPPAVPVDGGPQATAAVPEPAPAAVPVESAAPAEEVAPAVPEAAAAVEPEPAPPAAARPSIETPAVASAEAPAATVTDLLPATDETIDVAPGEVRISRAKSPDEASRAIMDAYAAYSRGDYPAAESLYRAALAKSPESRDALLGLAAVAMRRGDRQQAADLYGRLLKLNPRDSVAATALVGLRRSDDAGGDESRLKLMMDQTPEPAYLHFALGNVYARQGRWAEAQQAYFEAWRRQNDNSDYIYNLAVSLDHLGSRPAALDYYRKALALADRQTVNFTTSQVMSRIQSLGVADGDVAVP